MTNDLSQITDERLARVAAAGDRAAFNELMQRYCKPLAEFAASRTATVQDAEDIVQETFLRAYMNLASYDPQYPVKCWLFTIAYRQIINGYRKKKPVRLSDQTALDVEAKSQDSESEHDWLWQIIQGLSVDDRTVLWLRYKQDMPIEEIARVMKRKKLTIRVRLHRARNRLAVLIHELPEKSRCWRLSGTVDLKGVD